MKMYWNTVLKLNLSYHPKGIIKSGNRFTETVPIAADSCIRPKASDLSASLSGDGYES